MGLGDWRDSLSFNPVGANNTGLDISSAVTITLTGATKIQIQCSAQNVRYTLDGTAPEAAVGFQLKADDPPIILELGIDTTLKMIEEAATTVLNYQLGNGG